MYPTKMEANGHIYPINTDYKVGLACFKALNDTEITDTERFYAIETLLLGENVLQVQFTGHCAGCPYAQNTLQNVIVKTFKRYLPQIKEVRLKE